MPMTMTDDGAMMAWQSARGQRVRLTASVVVAAGPDDHDDDDNGGTMAWGHGHLHAAPTRRAARSQAQAVWQPGSRHAALGGLGDAPLKPRCS